MTTKLKEITFLTIKNLKNNEIILPGDYLKVFDQIAKELKLDLQDNLLMEKELSYSTDKINKIVEKTSKNLTQMHSSTKKAQKAILDKDDVSLSSISDEISDMQKQISFLQKELFSDTLTQAYNRKWFNDSYLKEEKFPENGKFAFLDIKKAPAFFTPQPPNTIAREFEYANIPCLLLAVPDVSMLKSCPMIGRNPPFVAPNAG